MPRFQPYQIPGAPRVQNGPFSEGQDLSYGAPQASFGADAEIQRRQRALSLAGLDQQAEQMRLASEPQALQLQRKNLAAHGTIETPQDFARRSGELDAAAAMDPSNPHGALRGDEHRRKMDQTYQSNVRPAEIAGQTQRDIEGSRAATARRGQDLGLEGDQYQADVDAGTSEYETELDLLQRFYDHPDMLKTQTLRDQALAAFRREMQRSMTGGQSAAPQ